MEIKKEMMVKLKEQEEHMQGFMQVQLEQISQARNEAVEEEKAADRVGSKRSGRD